MSHPDEELLADLALGSGDEVSAEVRDHVEGCPDCRFTVEELRRILALASGAEGSATWSHPPERVWARIEDAIDTGSPTQARDTAASADASGAEADRADAEKPAAGAAIAGPATVDAPATVAALETGATRRAGRRVVPWAAGMAAAGLAIGLLSGRALWNEDPPAPATIAQAQLDTLDTNQRLGEASVIRTGLGVDLKVATAKPFPAGDGFIEVWLINKDGKRMVSVGVLRGSSPETFPISQTLIDQGYTTVDISREGFDNKPQHSGDSLARGTLSI
jgi:Anti-sigma-K factor rskA